jgi:hypothetical protein
VSYQCNCGATFEHPVQRTAHMATCPAMNNDDKRPPREIHFKTYLKPEPAIVYIMDKCTHDLWRLEQDWAFVEKSYAYELERENERLKAESAGLDGLYTREKMLTYVALETERDQLKARVAELEKERESGGRD